MGGFCEVVELSKSNLVLGSRGSGTVGLVDALGDPVGSIFGFLRSIGHRTRMGRSWQRYGLLNNRFIASRVTMEAKAYT